ncbi:hypothetical protein A2Z23_01195 [Candidatus Curtissbacteria bacterium RBG_16_39_7]|uniref:KOW domain-containing protein n=1 Tax=Candidatus Curtissbacteria bacterium RBG_16_39_7 TaxID=1797707 RepID=A0A1F5G4N1_9BACT|nr:MAG: hypothetical protein A2Z23_01195 [Candidatus Curtissbacteria bacterium RBG_16_39_7]
MAGKFLAGILNMIKLLAKIRRRVENVEEQSLKRSLETPGKILVKKGDKVKTEDIIAEGVLTSGFRSLPLAKILGVKPKEAGSFLLKKEGEKVRPGEIIAQRKRLFGISKVIVSSPIEGTFSGYDNESGVLRLEFLPQIQRLVAICDGEVEEVPDRRTVIVSCFVSKVYGVCGAGRTREGVLKVLAQKNDFLLPSAIDETCTGAIIVGGALVSKAALNKAITVGVGGIIAGGINARDFFEIGGASTSPFWTSSDVGLTLVLTEGFGRRDMSDEIFSHLEKHKDRCVLIDGDQAVLTIPQSPESPKKPSPKYGETYKEWVEREIDVGDRVRIIDYDSLGVQGTVKNINTKSESVSSGLQTYTVEIETEKGKIEVPYQNIEILV